MVQQSVQNLALGFPGQKVGLGVFRTRSYKNDKGAAAQVSDVTITAVNSTTYTMTVNGHVFTYTSDSSATVAEIRDGLIAAGKLVPELEDAVALNASGNKVRVTSLKAGTAFTLTVGANLAAAAVQANVARSFIGFGLALVQGNGPGGDQSAFLPAGAGGTFIGMAARVHSGTDTLDRDHLDSYSPGAMMAVVEDGPMYARVEVAVTKGDDVFFRHTANGALTTLGAWRNDDDGGNADQATACKFRTSASAGGIAEIEIAL
jgi:hypothetical protein